MKKNKKLLLALALLIGGLGFFNSVYSQTNVTLNSVSPGNGTINSPVILYGINLNKCSPPPDQSYWSPQCNVQFHDIESRRSTVSGTEESNSSNTRVNANVPGDLCPGRYTVRVGEVANYSNRIQFTVDEGSVVPSDQGVPISCRFITSISPTSGLPGASVVIYGKNLNPTVHFYTLPSGLAVASTANLVTSITGTINTNKTQVTFIVPQGVNPGQYTVRVGPNQNDLSNGVNFTFIGDTTPPIISNVNAINITTSSATIVWNTNETADSQVELCNSWLKCGNTTQLDTNFVTNHSVNLSGLNPGTKYYYWVKSKDKVGNLRVVGYYTFNTLGQRLPLPPPPAQIRPVISNIRVTNVTYYSVTVSWNTDIPTTGAIVACTNTFFCYSGWAADPSLSTDHSLTIDRLRSDTQYYVWIISKNSAGVSGNASTEYFRTQPGLAISNLNASSTSTSINVNWDTNHASSSLLIVCRFFVWCFGAVVVYDETAVLSHTITATGLDPGTTYYFYVVSKDVLGYRVYANSSVATSP